MGFSGRAVSMLIDRRGWSLDVQGEDGQPQFPVPSLVFPDLAHRVDEVEEALPFDPERAKRLLDEAGFGSGFRTLLFVRGNTDLRGAEVIASHLSFAGIEVEIIDNVAELNRRIREEGGYRGMLLRGLGDSGDSR